jgi:3-keto-5-aminohexanoate cleavage enzyme
MCFQSKLTIDFTPAGRISTKAMTPHVPISVNEVIEDVLEHGRREF